MSSCVCALVHHSDSGLGSISRSINSSMMSFTIQIISLCCRRTASSCQPTSFFAPRTHCHAVLKRVTTRISTFIQPSTAPTWLHASTALGPPHLLGECTENTSTPSHNSRSRLILERPASLPANPPSGVREGGCVAKVCLPAEIRLRKLQLSLRLFTFPKKSGSPDLSFA